ncbi:hypothetical protein C7M84_009229 [Penaeus vannamei]|uniref:RNA-directed DNA polymerase n=1 Tax=Penaeus vannamei TaxID=6689 RepID=A0A423T7F4_PENVA|nr:hypothetical protein C7M84_009229 [Penaeus vannamei]
MLVTNLPPELLLTVGNLLNDQRNATYNELKEAILRRAAPNPLTTLSSFLSSDTMDNRTPSEILRYFQRLLTRTSMTFTPDVMHSLFLKRLPADIQQILLVSDAPLEQLALKADVIIAAKTRAPSVATVFATAATVGIPYSPGRCTVRGCTEIIHTGAFTLPASLPHPFAAAQRTELQAPFTVKTPVPFTRTFREMATTETECASFPRTSSAFTVRPGCLFLPPFPHRQGGRGAPSQRFQWIFLVADVPQPIIGAVFLEHYGLSVDLQGKALIHQSGARTLAAPTLPINRATQLRHEVHHHIVTHGPPAHSRCRPLAPNKCRSAKAEFDHMMQLGIIRPSSSQWAAPLHLVKKKDGDWRPCGDYRHLNMVTAPDRYPLQHLHSSHEPSSCTVFSRIDLRFINDVTRGLEGVFAYIDILVASASEADHARHLRALFGRLQEAGVVINPGKCLFGAASLSFLGHTVTLLGIIPAQEKVTTIRKFPKPAMEKQLQKFQGMFNFYRKFVLKCAQLLKPFHVLITPNRASRNTKIKWTPPTNEAFEACKEALASATLLNHPLPEAPLNIVVDASDTAIGATLSPRQLQYSAFGRELLSAYSALRHFKPYVEAKEFHILTDHKPLTFALHSRTRCQSPREERHLDYISQFTTDIRHIQGADNETADALSRVTIAAATHADVAVDYHLVRSEHRQDASMTLLIEGQTSLSLE